MSSACLPVAELLEADPDEYYEQLDAYLKAQMTHYQGLEMPPPNLEADHLILVSQIYIELRAKIRVIDSALLALEEELDTGALQRQSQSLDSLAAKYFQNLLQSNQMVYLLGEVKIMRKQAKRLSRKIQRAYDLGAYQVIEQEADQIVGGAGFQSQIESFAEQGLGVEALWEAHRQMEKQIDKMRDVFDGVSERLTNLPSDINKE